MDKSNYNEIALDYDLKRRYPWNTVQDFISFVHNKGYHFKGLCLDLGCANGRHFIIFKKLCEKLIGIDNSIEFLRIARKTLKSEINLTYQEGNAINLILADFSFLPIREHFIDGIFSIATLHHIKGRKNRERALFSVSNTLKNQGFFLITVWRKYQKRFRFYFIIDWLKRKMSKKYYQKQKSLELYESGDKLIPWKFSYLRSPYNRFYHFFSKKEIIILLKDFKILEILKMGGQSKKDNFFILAQNNKQF